MVNSDGFVDRGSLLVYRIGTANNGQNQFMILQKIRERAAADPQHIILPEGEDARTLRAAELCSQQRIAKITLIGNEEKIKVLASGAGTNLNGIEILDHRASHHEFGKMAELYHQMRRSKGVTLEEAEQTVK